MELVLITLFALSPLEKVFPDTPVPPQPAQGVVLWCARNEAECAQIAVRSTQALTGATVRVGPLKHVGGYTLPTEAVQWNFVGSIPLKKNTPCENATTLARKAPCDMPDVLLAERARDIPANSTQAIYLTVTVPKDAPDGRYTGTVTLVADGKETSLPVELNVWPFTVPDERHLFVTNWINHGTIAKAHKVELWSDAFFAIYGKYLDNMHAHRQNIAWVPWSLIKVTEKNGGRLSFDYVLFDRYVEELHKHGVADRIEIMFVGHFKDGWSGREIALTRLEVKDAKTGQRKKLEFDQGLALLLHDLEQHLEQKGWLDKAVIHIADESSQYTVLSWREQSRRVHQAAPRLKRIDAIEASDFGDDLEVWVPKLSHLKNWLPQYQAQQRAGKELWFYICCHPTGGYYPNRFLDYRLGMVRLIHWLNAAYDLAGYLHWGWCAWKSDDPFGAPPDTLPPGDTHTVYPGPDGPLNSLRWEAQRDSLEDFEYLWLLTQRMKDVKQKLGKVAAEFDPAERGKDFCRRLVRDFADVTSDPREIEETRRALAAEIIAAPQEPLVMWTTRPAEWSELVPGPIAVEVHGAVQPGTTIKGLNVVIEPSGRFRGVTHLSAKHSKIELTFTRDGATKTLVRQFRVRTAPATAAAK
ncbi:MAG: DUF4091 domain-containing protein [Verrucomicrobia bacterium]|nr:DUF4091 domain-containing protein [Verrucomicrobiota bacterium]